MKAEYIGGTHINYFIHCKRLLWYYLNKISLENNDEFVQIAKIKHDSHFNRNNIKEIQIGNIKIDIIDKICIREIKTSKIVKEEHIYQLKYYIYYLNKYCETNINKGMTHYVNISKKINIIYDSRDTSFIEDFIKGIINVSKQKFIIGASSNIMRNIKNRIKSDIKSIEAFKNYISKIPKSETINELMAIEGNIRKKYYSEIDLYMKKNKNNDFIMDKRIIRPPNNKMNSLIFFGNSLLYATVLNEIFKTQLNPTISYLHEVQTSRFSLALDISEIFKPIIVDRIVLNIVNLKQIKNSHFTKIDKACFLNAKGKKLFIQEYDKKLKSNLFLRKLNKTVTYKYLIRLECYKLIKYLTENIDYIPYIEKS